jgi:dTDP-4-dehydrorhamnose reductase
MKQPSLLILGSNGQVGWELRRTLAPLGVVNGVDYPDIDLTQADSLRQGLDHYSPDVVVNAAAYTAVDQAESEPELCRTINAGAPGILAEEAARRRALLVHYSTDYVFDGTRKTPYAETDAPNPLSVYGRTKLAGDQAIGQSGCDHLIFRLCWVYGARGKNFMRTMMKLAGERELLRVVADQFGCPSWSRMIAETTAQAVAQTLRSAERSSLAGTYHLAASGQTSWHGFAQAIIDSLPADRRKCAKVEAIPASDYPTPARRPANSVLDCGKLERTFGLRLPDWQASLNHVLEP